MKNPDYNNYLNSNNENIFLSNSQINFDSNRLLVNLSDANSLDNTTNNTDNIHDIKTKRYTINDYCDYQKIKNNINNLNYHLSIDKENSISNWSYNYELYCENEYKKNYLTSFIFAFSILSNIFMSLLADRYGRKICFLIETFGIFISFIFLFFFSTNNFLILFISIFGMQIFTHAFTLSYIYLYEFFSKSISYWIFLIQNVLFSSLGILIYYIVEKYKNLYYIELTTLIISGVVFILSYLYILESPDWIISKMKHAEDNVIDLLEENENENITKGKFNENMKKIKDFTSEFHHLKINICGIYKNFLKWDDTKTNNEKKEYSIFDINLF